MTAPTLIAKLRHGLAAAAAGLVGLSGVPAMAQNAAPDLTRPVPTEDEALKAAIAADTRSETDRARDAFRRPYESLTFWGLRPGLTVVEIEPGRGGWWSAILEPYAQATSGRYVAVNRPLEDMGVAPGEADFILVARAFHNWHRAGRTDAYMQVFFDSLAPGGILAIEQHRALPGSDPDLTAPTGYVSERHVIDAALRAGFELDASSELNANPADDRDHAFGVWTLPPVRRSEGDGRTLTPAERQAYDAIGESDRMTLRLRKPG